MKKINYRHQKANWPISLEELKNRRDQCNRHQNIISVIWSVVFIAILFANIPLATKIDELQKKALWIGITYGIVFLSFLFGNLIITFKVLKNHFRSFNLVCPECNQSLSQQFMMLAITTGRCANCGCLLVRDHPGINSEQ